MTYKPAQREVKAKILTPTGWLEGVFHIPKKSWFADYLSHEHDFVRVTSVGLPNGEEYPFFALHRAAMILILPMETETIERGSERLVPHALLCLLEAGSLQGEIDILPGIRVSDYFHTQSRFVTMHDATLKVGGEDEQKVHRVLVNSDRILGVSELDQP